MTAGVEPGERVASGADGSGEGAGEGTLVSRLFSPSGPGCRAVSGMCSGLELAKGCPKVLVLEEQQGAVTGGRGRYQMSFRFLLCVLVSLAKFQPFST